MTSEEEVKSNVSLINLFFSNAAPPKRYTEVYAKLGGAYVVRFAGLCLVKCGVGNCEQLLYARFQPCIFGI